MNSNMCESNKNDWDHSYGFALSVNERKSAQ